MTNALNEVFEVVTVLGIRMLFTCDRVDRSTVPQRLYLYEVRYDGYGTPEDQMEIAKWVIVDFWGTLISREPLALQPEENGNAFLLMDQERDWNYEDSSSTLSDYLKEEKET